MLPYYYYHYYFEHYFMLNNPFGYIYYKTSSKYKIQFMPEDIQVGLL